MKRYKKIVLEAEKGINFKVSEGTSGELIIRALNKVKVNVHSTNYLNPPIPEGYNHILGEWNNGFVIERCSDGSQFVWIPVEKIDCHEVLNDELLEQLESVIKYRGFYISRYNISKNLTGQPQSVKGAMPWVNINFYEAKSFASIMEVKETVKSHLTFGMEYDSILEWFIKTKAKTRAEIIKDSTEWGNYANTKNSPQRIVETGSREDWCVNNIYDLAGNVMEWTQEQNEKMFNAIRGGVYCNDGDKYPVAYRIFSNPFTGYFFTGFRAALCIK